MHYLTRTLALLTFALATEAALLGASIESQFRRINSSAVLIDYDTGLSDEDQTGQASLAPGLFDQASTAHAAVGSNQASAESAQTTTIDVSALRFSGNGSVGAESIASSDGAMTGLMIESRGANDFEIVFRLNRPGKVRLSTMLSTTNSASAGIWINHADSHVLVWSRTGNAAFEGDVALKKGRYRLRINLSAGATDGGGQDRVSTASASFQVAGQIVEN